MTKLTCGIVLAVMLLCAAVCAYLSRRLSGKAARLKWIPATVCCLSELSAAILLLIRRDSLEELFLVMLVFAAVTFTVGYGQFGAKKAKTKASKSKSDAKAASATETAAVTTTTEA